MKKLEGNRHISTGSVRAFVLCGGQGTRLRSVVADRPKSMALISGTPFLQLLLERLGSQGVDDVVLGTGYMAEKIERYFGDGKQFALRIRYSREHEPRGTGGALKLAEPLISDPILVLNGDSYVEWDLVPVLELFKTKDADLVIVLQTVADVTRYGSVALDQDGRVTQFVEKGVAAGPGLNQRRRLFASKTDRARSASRHSDLAGDRGISPPSRPPGVWVGLHRDFHRYRNTAGFEAGAKTARLAYQQNFP